MAVDLKEPSLRESEQVEWKENVAGVEVVVRVIVAYANDFSNANWGGQSVTPILCSFT